MSNHDSSARAEPYLWWNRGERSQEVMVRWWQGTTQVYCNWGDYSGAQIVPVGGSLTHHYPTPGAYMIQFRQLGGSQPVIAEQQVVIRPGFPKLDIEVDPNNPTEAVIRVPKDLEMHGIVPFYHVFWSFPNQDLQEDFWGFPGTELRHVLPAGKHKVRVRDEGTRWAVEPEIRMPGGSLEFSLKHGSTERMVVLDVTRADPGKKLHIDWGDGSEPVRMITPGGAHTYAANDVYLIQLFYSDFSDSTTKAVAVPMPIGGAQ